MSDPFSSSFVGNLFAPRWPDRPPSLNFERIPGLKRGDETGVSGWSKYVLVTDHPLTRETDLAAGQATFKYPVLVRRSRPRFLLACSATEVLTHVMRTGALVSQVSPPQIQVARLVQDLSQTPDQYAMGALF